VATKWRAGGPWAEKDWTDGTAYTEKEAEARLAELRADKSDERE